MLTTGGLRPRLTFTDDEIRTLGAAGAIVRDRVLGEAAATTLAGDLGRYRGDLVPAGMGPSAARWFDRTERGDEIAWLDPAAAPPSFAPLVDTFGQVMLALNRGAYAGLRRYDIQLARYPGGGARYARHADAFRARLGVRRRFTAIYYVNPGWRAEHGGLLRLYTPSATIDVEPVLDRLVVFASDAVEHEVLPCYAERRAITAWYYIDPQ